jgi:hypothetical protein
MAVYPDPAQVLFGVEYGPNDNDYVGTYIIPDNNYYSQLGTPYGNNGETYGNYYDVDRFGVIGYIDNPVTYGPNNEWLSGMNFANNFLDLIPTNAEIINIDGLGWVSGNYVPTSVNDLLDGVIVGDPNNPITGNVVLPETSEVVKDVTFGSLNSLVGTVNVFIPDTSDTLLYGMTNLENALLASSAYQDFIQYPNNPEDTIFKFDVDYDELTFDNFSLILLGEGYKRELTAWGITYKYKTTNDFSIVFMSFIERNDSTSEKIIDLSENVYSIMKDLESLNIISTWSIEKDYPTRNEVSANQHLVAIKINIQLPDTVS